MMMSILGKFRMKVSKMRDMMGWGVLVIDLGMIEMMMMYMVKLMVVGSISVLIKFIKMMNCIEK